jgi:hypothetical protein
MAAERLSSLDASLKSDGSSCSVRRCMTEMQNDVSLAIVRCSSWVNSIDIGNEYSCKNRGHQNAGLLEAFGQTETEWGPENSQHSFGARDCLPRLNWNGCAPRDPSLVGIILEIES